MRNITIIRELPKEKNAAFEFYDIFNKDFEPPAPVLRYI